RVVERDRPASHGAAPGHGRLHGAVRRHPDLDLTLRQGDRHRIVHVAHHVPGVLTTHDEDLPLLTADGLLAAAPGRVEGLRAYELVTQRGRLVVDRPREAFQVEAG